MCSAYTAILYIDPLSEIIRSMMIIVIVGALNISQYSISIPLGSCVLVVVPVLHSLFFLLPSSNSSVIELIRFDLSHQPVNNRRDERGQKLVEKTETATKEMENMRKSNNNNNNQSRKWL